MPNKLTTGPRKHEVRTIYEMVQHWTWDELSELNDLLLEPSIWITGDDSISDRERIMTANDKVLTSVMAGLKCFWLMDQSSATTINFFDIRADNFAIKRHMFHRLYDDGADPLEVRDEMLSIVNSSFNIDGDDPLWSQIGKRDVSNCTVNWDLVNVCQNPQYLIDRMDTTPSSIYLSNIFDNDNDSSHLYEDFSVLQTAIDDYRRRGGKVWMHNENGFIT